MLDGCSGPTRLVAMDLIIHAYCNYAIQVYIYSVVKQNDSRI